MNMETRTLPKDFLQPTGHGECAVACPASLSTESTLAEILLFARQDGASDVHLSTNAPGNLRKAGALRQVTEGAFTADRLAQMLEQSLPADKWQKVKETGDIEFVHALPGGGRFRMVVNRQRFGWDLTARVIDKEIRTFEASGMPASCQGLTKWAQGLVLVAGPAGCGKSSTLATLVEMVNQTRDDHIITIENPIEIVYTPRKCQISQREVNLHTLSSANALRAALREDPDIIIVSELRDLETIQLAVTAAETGHLVFATMNTNNAAQTITSLIGSFSPDEQPVIRNMVAESLRGVICQQLIPASDGQSVVPAFEVLVMNSAAGAMIKSGRTNQINNVIATGKNEGMVLLDNAMLALVSKGAIKGQEAYRRAINQNLFAQYGGNAHG
ncbi:MAG: PilT/PilU family type 4a pilus ATPase [Candidatus Omnitrophica bacterium]|nr:PilT/PilU family type 4a pilus ATPase [Candidatus Omnitrophota bacterium]